MPRPPHWRPGRRARVQPRPSTPGCGRLAAGGPQPGPAAAAPGPRRCEVTTRQARRPPRPRAPPRGRGLLQPPAEPLVPVRQHVGQRAPAPPT
eukprot:7399775-Lingulodinium_polyedra.AAC.1